MPTKVTIPLNVTAPDKCHNSPRQMSQPTTNVTKLPRQMSQPTTNVTTLPRQMSQATINVTTLPRQMSHPTTNGTTWPRQMSQPTTNSTTLPRQMSQPTTKLTTLPWLPTTNVTNSRQMSVVTLSLVSPVAKKWTGIFFQGFYIDKSSYTPRAGALV